MKLGKRLHTGAVSCFIRGVGAVEQDGVSILQRPLLKRAKQPRFAVVAAVGRVFCNVRICQRVELDDRKLRAKLRAQPLCVFQFECRLERGFDKIRAYLCTGAYTGIEQV